MESRSVFRGDGEVQTAYSGPDMPIRTKLGQKIGEIRTKLQQLSGRKFKIWGLIYPILSWDHATCSIPGRSWHHNVERSLVYVLSTIALSSSHHHEMHDLSLDAQCFHILILMKIKLQILPMYLNLKWNARDRVEGWTCRARWYSWAEALLVARRHSWEHPFSRPSGWCWILSPYL